MGMFENFRTRVAKKVDSPQDLSPSSESGKMLITSPDAQLIEQHKRASGDRYVTIRFLEKGGNGHVDLCRDTQAGTFVAVKTIHYPNTRSPPKEVSILKQLGHHPNIVQYHTMLPHPHLQHHIQLVLEYCPMGDIINYIIVFRDQVPEMFLWHILKHISGALQFLHERGIVHGDVKPDNILLSAHRDREPYPLPKLADFGCASLNPAHDIPRAHLATIAYSPPEATTQYGPETDIWSLGCVIYELAHTGDLPMQYIGEPGSDWDAKSYFHINEFEIPRGTLDTKGYQEMILYKAFHPYRCLRIDRQSLKKGMTYSKLLNYVMMRTMNTDTTKRIKAGKLHQFLAVLEPLVRQLIVLGQEHILEVFDEGLETDLQIFRQIFERVAVETYRSRRVEMELALRFAMKLLPLMEGKDEKACLQFVTGLGDARQKGSVGGGL